MARSFPVRPLRFACAVALAAATSAVAPQFALGGCGDYVTIGGRSAHLATSTRQSGVLGHFGLAPQHLNTAAAEQSTSLASRPFSRPCQGPECGRLPVQAPPSAPIPNNPFESTQVAVLAAGNSFSIFGCHRMLAGLAEEPVEGFPARVERPPRTVAIVS